MGLLKMDHVVIFCQMNRISRRAYWMICLLAYWLIGLLAYCLVGLFAFGFCLLSLGSLAYWILAFGFWLFGFSVFWLIGLLAFGIFACGFLLLASGLMV